MGSRITVHRFQASLFPVNAYLVETPTAVVAIDATLGVSDGRALNARADALGKPLAGVIVTHSHPDHYGGTTALLGGTSLPVYAVAGVDHVIRRDDAEKERILRPMFGAECGPRPERFRIDGSQTASAWCWARRRSGSPMPDRVSRRMIAGGRWMPTVRPRCSWAISCTAICTPILRTASTSTGW
jgi:hypothetical protein